MIISLYQPYSEEIERSRVQSIPKLVNQKFSLLKLFSIVQLIKIINLRFSQHIYFITKHKLKYDYFNYIVN